MRSLLRHLGVCCLFATGCRWFGDSTFPASTIAVEPPAYYRTWWQLVESCAGRRTSFDDVSWYTAPPYELVVRGEIAQGAWFASENAIAVIDGYQDYGPLVRHEMLHAVLRDGGHSAEYFTGKCGDEVICGRECGPNTAPAGAIEAAVTALEVDATLYPSALSLSRQDGRATVVVRVRNPSGTSVFVPGRLFAATNCAVGYQIAAVTDPARYDMNCDLFRLHADGRIYWGPGETRRIVLESDLRVSAFANPLGIVAISVSAILADNLRKTTLATIRP